MATTGRPDAPATPASDVATNCSEAGLVRVVGAASGEGLAAVGLLGRALADADVPYQARLAPAASESIGRTDADCTITISRPDLSADHAVGSTPDESAIERAYAIAAAIGEADPVLGLAGALAANVEPPSRISEDAGAAGLDRRPGVAVPTADLADGLAHTTLVHAPFSGDREAAEAALADLDLADEPTEDDRRRVASLVALSVAETDGCPPQATRAIERALHPSAGGPFQTVGGYADVLDALARTDPGLGIAVALGHDEVEAALEAWRTHGRRVHSAVGDADMVRYDGLVVANADSVDSAEVLESVARLVRDFRSPEPLVVGRGADAVVLTTTGEERDAAEQRNVAELLADATAEVDGDAPVVGDARMATVAIAGDNEAVVEAVKRTIR